MTPAMGDVTMPRLSDSMEEGTIVQWLRATGDEVSRGDDLVEIETDKATMIYEAETSGTLEIVAAVGDTVALGGVIARIGVPGAEAPRGAEPDKDASVQTAEAALTEDTPAPRAVEPLAPAPGAVKGSAGNGRAFASPVARRIALAAGIDLAGVTGTGPRGRIVKLDVEAAAARSGASVGQAGAPQTAPSGLASVEAAPVAAATHGAKGEVTRIEPTKIQRVAARRMAESKATAPEFNLQVEVDMTRAVELRTQIKGFLDGASAPTINDMVVKACALALRKHPKANGAYRDGAFELYSRVNIGVALAIDNGLLVPTVFDADVKSLREISQTVRGLAARGREGKITPPELSGGTFSVSNLGMYGMRSFTAVLNPPQAAILAVGALADRPWVEDGVLVVRPTMSLSLTVDHRILNGAEAAEVLMTITEYLQSPGPLAFQ